MQGRWAGDISFFYPRKFAGGESQEVQHQRVAKWESVAECRRRDAADAGPCLILGELAVGKHRLTLWNAPGGGGVTSELLATLVPLAGSTVYTLSLKRLTGGTSHADRVDGWPA